MIIEQKIIPIFNEIIKNLIQLIIGSRDLYSRISLQKFIIQATYSTLFYIENRDSKIFCQECSIERIVEQQVILISLWHKNKRKSC